MKSGVRRRSLAFGVAVAAVVAAAAGCSTSSSSNAAAGSAAGGGASSAVGGVVIGGYALAFISNWLYFALMESSRWQGTVGKQAFKLIVTDEHGERISFGRATGRYFAKLLSSVILMFGYFMVGWTQRKRGLHDMIAGTLVYKADSPELPRNSARVFE